MFILVFAGSSLITPLVQISTGARIAQYTTVPRETKVRSNWSISRTMIGRAAQQVHRIAGTITRSSSTHAGKVAIVTASTEGYK